MHLIAHRGLYNDIIKENTLEAYLKAIRQGYDGIELDIRLTKDNQIVCIHDKLINRTSNGKGNINNYTYKELLKYNSGSKKIKSKIPLLKTVINKINNKSIIIEIKEKIDIKEIEKIIEKNPTNDYYICSFNKKFVGFKKNNIYKKGLINYVFNSKINLKEYDFVLILENLFNDNINNYLKNINVEPIIYGTLNKINIKNKEYINNLKYII